jgi:GMP synthase (glutamine-hydrolysing)
MSSDPRGVLIVDLGTQYTQLIARRVREAGTWCQITVPSKAMEAAAGMDLGGIILSGGPSSVYDDDAPDVPEGLLSLDVPVLGICYGMQWMCKTLGGEVKASDTREYGRVSMRVTRSEGLFKDIGGHTVMWMSHGDSVSKLPEGFEVFADSEDCPFAAVGDTDRNFWGVQFHPEVSHSVRGREVLDNFLARLCRLMGDWKPDSIVEREIAKIHEIVGEEGEVILGLSGGVDSSVAAMMISKAIGPRLHCIFVDNGLLRKGEREAVEEEFREHLGMDLVVVDAGKRFLDKLAGVTDPEQKRKIIGHEFVEVFREEAKNFKNSGFLGQGTLYPDVIESVNVHGGNTAVIKSHHNVGGLPEDLDMELVEPLRELFKDEVRTIGRFLGLDEQIVGRQPFPGPGLAVRIIGEVTPEKVALLQEADHICTTEIEKAGEHLDLWQYFAVLLPVQSVGVMGDQRTYENACALRIVESADGMTADWGYLSRETLQSISSKIINRVRGINRVVLDISSKPPSTIEWE